MELATMPRDFGFTEDHALLQASARRFFRDRFGRSALRALYDEQQRPPTLAHEIGALGWHDHRLLGYLGAALIAEEAGRVLCPVPITQAILAHELLARAGEEELAALVREGELAPHVVPFARPGQRVGGLHRSTRLVLLLAADGAWRRLTLPDDGGPLLEHEETLDATRGGLAITLAPGADGTEVLACDLSADEVLARALTLLAAESCGAADAVLEMTCDYARERQQFGRPIGTFQAVSHPLVNTLIAVEQARSLTVAAAAALDGGAPTAQVVTLGRMAKAAASEALRDAASRGVQLHGGFGFTWDCDVHFFFRRSLHDHACLGGPAEHRAALLDTLLRA